jgi:hypothetical protein
VPAKLGIGSTSRDHPLRDFIDASGYYHHLHLAFHFAANSHLAGVSQINPG